MLFKAKCLMKINLIINNLQGSFRDNDFEHMTFRVVGSDGNAACGRKSDLSEWPQPRCSALPVVDAAENHPNLRAFQVGKSYYFF